MEINSYYEIKIEYTLHSTFKSFFNLKASDFFEFEEYSMEEWNCELPWKKTDIRNYIRDTEIDDIQEVILLISHRNTQRKIIFRYLKDFYFHIDWPNLFESDEFHICHSLKEIQSDIHHFTKCSLMHNSITNFKKEIFDNATETFQD